MPKNKKQKAHVEFYARRIKWAEYFSTANILLLHYGGCKFLQFQIDKNSRE